MPSLATVAELKDYAKKLNFDAGGEALLQRYLYAAEDVVSKYLGFAPAAATYTHTFYGDGKPYITLRAPVNGTITSITIDSVAQTVSDWTVDGETITNKYGNPLAVGSLAVVVYSGGYATVPDAIIVVILEIATLKMMGSGEGIGLQGTSFDNGQTRTFTNYTNYSKYLEPLANLRIARLERKTP